MKVVRYVAVGVLVGVFLGAVAFGAGAGGDIKRYVRMRSM
jgi:hypothetical protein